MAQGARDHIDSLELVSSRARQQFATAAGVELGLQATVIKAELGRVESSGRVEAALGHPPVITT